MSQSADEPTPSERMSATSSGVRRFRKQPAHSGDPMLPEAPYTDMSSCLAVVPAYNERVTVAGVVDALRRKAPQLDVLVIDDGSTDATAQIAEDAGAQVLRL